MSMTLGVKNFESCYELLHNCALNMYKYVLTYIAECKVTDMQSL